MNDQQDNIPEQEFAKFINSIKNGQVEQVQNIIRQYPSIVNKLDITNKQPPIYIAALIPSDIKSEEMIRVLIRNGANFKFKDKISQTVLFYVCREGKQKCAEVLLRHGLSLDEQDTYGQTPLFYAANENRLQIVRKYSTKQRVNHIDKLAGQTPLYYASRRGLLEMCKILIEKGTDICLTDSTGKTAIQYAKKSKFYDVADYLNHEYKKYKDISKVSFASHSLQDSNLQRRKKRDDAPKQSRQTYKIVYYNEKGEMKDLTEEDMKHLISLKPEIESFLSNPQTIPQNQIDQSNTQRWSKVALKILTQCCKLKGAFWFQQPVDPQKYNIADYFDVIAKPMDLMTVRKNIIYNVYSKASQFVQDMNLIWQNCYKYNGETHQISKSAKQLQIGFKQCLKNNSFHNFLGN